MKHVSDVIDGPDAAASESRLLHDIAYFEARLNAIGWSGDCAYEKSLARSYTSLLQQRRHSLDRLRHRSR